MYSTNITMKRSLPAALIVSALVVLSMVNAIDVGVRVMSTEKYIVLRTSQEKHAVTLDALPSIDVLCYSVNGQNWTIVDKDNEVHEQTSDEVSKDLLDWDQRMHDIIEEQFKFVSWDSTDVTIFPKDTKTFAQVFIPSISFSSFVSSFPDQKEPLRTGDGLTIIAIDNYSVKRDNLPFGWKRVFVKGDFVTTVSEDGNILMRPFSILNSVELEVMRKIQQEVKQHLEV